MKTGTRRPPSYQEYGSDLLGLEAVRLMPLAERGMLATLRWYCWANDSIPAEPKLMARLLGLEVQNVKEALTDRVRMFFAPFPSDKTRLYSPELAALMMATLARRKALSDAGGKGGKMTQRRRKAGSELEAKLKPGLKPPEMRRDRDRDRDETELGKGGGIPTPSQGEEDEFVRDLRRAEQQEAGSGQAGLSGLPLRQAVAAVLVKEGDTKRGASAFLGSRVTMCGESQLDPVLRECLKVRPADAKTWISGACRKLTPIRKSRRVRSS